MHVAKDAGWIWYGSRRTLGNAEFVAQYRATGPGFHPRPGTLEYFLTERYALYSVLPGEDYFRVTSTTRRGPCSQRRHHAQTLKQARPASLAFWQGFREHGSGAYEGT